MLHFLTLIICFFTFYLYNICLQRGDIFMNLEDKRKMLERSIMEISKKDHDELLLQELIKHYLGIYLVKEYQKLGKCIDICQKTTTNSENVFFGQIIKTGKGTSANDHGLGSYFANQFENNLIRKVIKHNEVLRQIYTNLGVLDKNQEEAEFWWNHIVYALTCFDFGDLCKIIPCGEFTDDWQDSYFILENDLKALLKEKEIPEENYHLDYGRLYGGRVLMVGDPIDNMFLNEFQKQRQKGLRIYHTRVKKKTCL